jgi:hypothetical protein
VASSCEAELCPFWTGDGCACSVLGIEHDATETSVCSLCSYTCNAPCGCECGC